MNRLLLEVITFSERMKKKYFYVRTSNKKLRINLKDGKKCPLYLWLLQPAWESWLFYTQSKPETRVTDWRTIMPSDFLVFSKSSLWRKLYIISRYACIVWFNEYLKAIPGFRKLSPNKLAKFWPFNLSRNTLYWKNHWEFCHH